MAAQAAQTPRYVQRIARLPRVFERLAAHPDGLPLATLAADPPGTARRVRAVTHAGLHPMTWEIDPPVEVTLRTTADYVPDVRRWLGEPQAEEEHDDAVVLRYRVTNRSALRARLYELGRRVRLVAPEDVRQEMVDELAAVAGVEGVQ